VLLVVDHTKLESSRTMEIFAKPSRCSYGIKNLWLPHGCVMLLFGAAAAGAAGGISSMCTCLGARSSALGSSWSG
jgi:hypothetical protein